ncbi:MAG: hypothetical protein ACOVP5_06570 [Chitinophagales bacterium]
MLRLLLGSAIFIFSCNLLNANIDSIVLNRIENFTKVYSLVKFYYPSDELVKFNWDKYSEYMISYALSAKSDSLFYQKLEYTLELIAPGVQVSHDLAEFKFQKLIPLDSNMFPKVTFLQSRYSLNRILESNYGSINYRYDRPDYKRKYIESRPSSKVQGKKIRLIIKGNIKGQSKGEKNFVLSQRYKYLNIDTTEDVSISINSSIDSTYLCELIIKENSYAFALIMYYPKENYILNVTDFKYEAFINEKWVNIDSVVVQRKERYPTVFFRHDYFMDSALIDSVNKFTTKSIFFDKIYDVSDTPISINVNGLTFFIPLKLRTSSNNTYPIVDSMKFANFNREIDIWNADDLVKDFNILSKIYGYLFLDYPYADRVFFNLLSDRFKLSLINRELFPSRSIDIWLENELLYFLGDPHMDIKKTNKHFLTSKFYGTTVIDNKCVINYTLDTSKLKLGDEIVEINCKPVHTYLGGLNKKTSLIQKTRFFENLLIELHNDTNQETYDLKTIAS